jgi:hypothetical protein
MYTTVAKSAKEKTLQINRHFLFEKIKASTKVACHKIKPVTRKEKKR